MVEFFLVGLIVLIWSAGVSACTYDCDSYKYGNWWRIMKTFLLCFFFWWLGAILVGMFAIGNWSGRKRAKAWFEKQE